MRKLIVLRTIILSVLLVAVIMVGCQQQPEPAPAPPTPAPTLPPPPAPTPKPTPTPAPPPPTPAPDEPKLSENEVCSLVWSRLPSELPDGYEKSQFFVDTKQATYEGKGEWTFVIFGSMEEIGPLQTKIYEKTTGHWVEEESQEVTTCELKLIADFYEKTRVFEIKDIEEFNEKVDTEITETPVPQELRVDWIKGEYDGSRYLFEGSVENVGKIPLHDIQIELVSFDEDGKLMTTERVPLEPEIIAPGELAHFLLRFSQREKLRSYDYTFITVSGEKFQRVGEDLFIFPDSTRPSA